MKKIIQISASRWCDGSPMVFALDSDGELWYTTDSLYKENIWKKLESLPPNTPSL